MTNNINNTQELTLDQIEAVNGGVLVADNHHKFVYIVDDNNGCIIGATPDHMAAINFANRVGFSSYTISPEEYKKMYGKEFAFFDFDR